MLKEIYNKLKKITENNEAFYSSIQEIDWYSIESFSYRLAQFNDFNLEHTKEMRWIAFIYWNEIKEPQLFTIGFHKFFNYHEWDIADKFRWEKIETIQDKIDWSLIMFWILPNWKIVTKSKTSINSEVANLADKISKNRYKTRKFYKKVYKFRNFSYFWICWSRKQNSIIL